MEFTHAKIWLTAPDLLPDPANPCTTGMMQFDSAHSAEAHTIAHNTHHMQAIPVGVAQRISFAIHDDAVNDKAMYDWIIDNAGAFFHARVTFVRDAYIGRLPTGNLYEVVVDKCTPCADDARDAVEHFIAHIGVKYCNYVFVASRATLPTGEQAVLRTTARTRITRAYAVESFGTVVWFVTPNGGAVCAAAVCESQALAMCHALGDGVTVCHMERAVVPSLRVDEFYSRYCNLADSAHVWVRIPRGISIGDIVADRGA